MPVSGEYGSRMRTAKKVVTGKPKRNRSRNKAAKKSRRKNRS